MDRFPYPKRLRAVMGLRACLFLMASILSISGCQTSERRQYALQCERFGIAAPETKWNAESSRALVAASNNGNLDALAVLNGLTSWDALYSDLASPQMQDAAISALPCARAGNSILGLFAATIGLHNPGNSKLAEFSRKWLYSDAAYSEPLAALGRAAMLERTGDRKGARKELQQAVGKNLNEVGRRAALLYLSGLFVKVDDVEAANWAKRAADGGDWRAQRLMALLYSSGRGVEKDDQAAEEYLRLAMENPMAEKNETEKQVLFDVYALPPTSQ